MSKPLRTSLKKLFGSRGATFFLQKRTAYFFLAAVFSWFCIDVWRRSTFIAPAPTSIVTYRDGTFMAQLGSGPGGYGYWPLAQVPARVGAAVLALEDRRFWRHPGVDPVAVVRALGEDVAGSRRVSGASTLAMQVARMQHPEARSLSSKVLEAAAAVVMTTRYGRAAVLRQYLMLAPFGQNSHGIGYAAAWYFQRPVADLSWAQIAFLSALPQAPGFYNPDHAAGLARAKARAALALARLQAQGVIDPQSYAEAMADLRQLTVRRYPARRPDALQAILQLRALARAMPAAEQIHSTIDPDLQRMVTVIARRRLAALQAQGARQVAVILADRQSMAVLALVGSADYAPVDDGEIDYALCWRSPGSTLKPFIFAQALDRGAVTPDSVLLDGVDNGTGIDNADRRFLGPLLPAQALANSRNVPAAILVRRDGLDASQWFLDQLDLSNGSRPAADYGLSMAIGGMPSRLDRLVAAYGALANQGAFQPLRWFAEQDLPAPVRVVSQNTARTVTLFLSDPMARLPSFARMGSTEFPFPVAVKTGTSEGYRDAWSLEFTDQYVIGVWVGRPDDQPMDAVSGATSAALIGQDVLMNLYDGAADGQNDGGFAAPSGSRATEVCAATGALADGNCAQQMVVYLNGNGAAPPADAVAASLRIVAPLDHSWFILNPDTPPGLAVLPLRAAGAPANSQVEWFVDGQPYREANAGDTVDWPVTPGRHVFQVGTDAEGARSRPVAVVVQ